MYIHTYTYIYRHTHPIVSYPNSGVVYLNQLRKAVFLTHPAGRRGLPPAADEFGALDLYRPGGSGLRGRLEDARGYGACFLSVETL